MGTAAQSDLNSWADRINSASGAAVESILVVGRVLTEAKAALPRGAWERLFDGHPEVVDSPVRFSIRTAQQFMAIAAHPLLSKAIHGSLLPASWRTLYYLSRLPEPVLTMALSDGTVHPAMERKDAHAALVAFRREENQSDAPVTATTCETGDLWELVNRGLTFGTIYADPPWLYDNQGTRAATGNHYEGMTIDELCALPVNKLAAPDAHLHLWTTNGFLFECPRIFAAWGFEFRSSFVWVKPQIGIGNYWRNAHEFLLTAIRGDAKSFADKSLRSWLECDRGRHSDKPDQVRAMLEKASPGPRLELFGRRLVDDWSVWGDQIERDLFHQSVDGAA